MEFFLGTHHPSWLTHAGVPLFVSRRRLAGRKTFPVAIERWAYDSGGFTELQMFGRWTIGAAEYAAETRRYRDAIGGMLWAAPQDWMCEPIVIAGGTTPQGINFAGTGLSVPEHQRRTVANLLELRAIAPDLPWIPVLQGWEIDDYHRHADAYESAGVVLGDEPVVGVGSVCRRQGTDEAADLFRELHGRGYSLHGFGLKIEGLKRCSRYLASSDSLAWSFSARRDDPLPGSTHKSCANCIKYAMKWRARVMEVIARPCQRFFF